MDKVGSSSRPDPTLRTETPGGPPKPAPELPIGSSTGPVDQIEATNRDKTPILGVPVPRDPLTTLADNAKKLEGARNSLGSITQTRDNYLKKSWTGLHLRDRLNGTYQKETSAYLANVDNLFHENPALALDELTKVGGPNGYLHFTDGKLSIRRDKPSGYSDASALNGLSEWIAGQREPIAPDAFNRLKQNARSIAERKNNSATNDAYTNLTKSLYRRYPQAAKDEILNGRGWGDNAPGGARYLTADQFGNVAIHDVKPRNYDRAEQLPGFRQWVANQGTFSSDEARAALNSSYMLHDDAIKSAGRFSNTTPTAWSSVGTADMIYDRSPQLINEMLERDLLLPGQSNGPAQRYLSLDPSGRFASVRLLGTKPPDFVNHATALSHWVATHGDQMTDAQLEGTKRYAQRYYNNLRTDVFGNKKEALDRLSQIIDDKIKSKQQPAKP